MNEFRDHSDICMVSRHMVDEKLLALDNRITVKGSENYDEINENSPEIDLRIVGTFNNNESVIQPNSIIVPEALFFNTDKLITTALGIQNWRNYIDFQFSINPDYNRDFENIKTELTRVLGDKWVLYSTSRELYNAAIPLEKKIDTQEKLFVLINILFMILPALFTLILCLSEKSEILIRLIFGEKKLKVIISSSLSIISMLVVYGVVLSLFLNSIELLDNKKLITIISISSIIAIIAIGYISNIKLIKLYQQREDN